ncbi:CPBP family intramembrane glutamic endopeptidase [Raoultella terrigena]|uniref:CPBP family intramembrane glutamic endopeptidase n=1 Tax=Raoultella terrigena TaxID=577 RepID=UPI00398BA746
MRWLYFPDFKFQRRSHILYSVRQKMPININLKNISRCNFLGKNTLTLGFVFLLSVFITFTPTLVYPKLLDMNLSFKVMVVLEFIVGFVTYLIFYMKSIGSIKNRIDILFISLAVLLSIQFFSYILQKHDIGSIKITSDNALSLFMLAIMIPFYEEVFYRGCLFDTLLSGFRGNLYLPAIITSVVFSLMHTQYSGVISFLIMFLISLILINAKLKTNNIITSIFLHSGMNSFFILINMQGFF